MPIWDACILSSDFLAVTGAMLEWSQGGELRQRGLLPWGKPLALEGAEYAALEAVDRTQGTGYTVLSASTAQ